MPASEEDISNRKLNIIKELLGSKFPSHVEGHSKDSLHSIKLHQFDENCMTSETDSEMSTEVIDNRQSYENSQSIAVTKDLFKTWSVTTEYKSNNPERIVNSISKMNQLCSNDLKNYKIQKKHRLFNSSEIIDVNNMIEDEKSISYSQNDDGDDNTSVKEAYLACVDIYCNDKYISSSCKNHVCEEPDKAVVGADLKANSVLLEIDLKEQRKSGRIQMNETGGITQGEELKNCGDDEIKYKNDLIETEKNSNKNENDMDADVETLEEKHILEKAEICPEMAYAEHEKYFHMLYSEMLSDCFTLPVSYPLMASFSLPSLIVPSFHQGCSTSLFESYISAEENRLSLEGPVCRNFCYQGNIFASRQTNMPSVFVSKEMFSQIGDLCRQPDKIFFNADSKACNLTNSFNRNLFIISILQKCESKDVFEFQDLSLEAYSDSESSYQNSLESEVLKCDSCIDTDLEEIWMSRQCTSSFEKFNTIQSEEDYDKVDDWLGKLRELNEYSLEQKSEKCVKMSWPEDSLNLNMTEKLDISDDYQVVESLESNGLFDTLESLIESFADAKYEEKMSDYFQEENEASLGELGDLQSEVREMEKSNFVNIGFNMFCSSEGLKNQCLKLSKPTAFKKNKALHCWTVCCNNDRRSSRNQQKVVLKDFDGGSKRTDNKPAKNNWKQGKSRSVRIKFVRFSWRNKRFQPLFFIVKNARKRRQNDRGKKNKHYRTEFEKMSRSKTSKLFHQEIKQFKRRKAKSKNVNNEKYKSKKSPDARKFIRRHTWQLQKPFSVGKLCQTQQMKHSKGCNLCLSGNPIFTLNLVEAKVCSHSGATGRNQKCHDSARSGSANGNQNNSISSAPTESGQTGNGRQDVSGGGSSAGRRRPGGSSPGSNRPGHSSPGGSRPGGSSPGISRPSNMGPGGSNPGGGSPDGSSPGGGRRPDSGNPQDSSPGGSRRGSNTSGGNSPGSSNSSGSTPDRSSPGNNSPDGSRHGSSDAGGGRPDSSRTGGNNPQNNSPGGRPGGSIPGGGGPGSNSMSGSNPQSNSPGSIRYGGSVPGGGGPGSNSTGGSNPQSNSPGGRPDGSTSSGGGGGGPGSNSTGGSKPQGIGTGGSKTQGNSPSSSRYIGSSLGGSGNNNNDNNTNNDKYSTKKSCTEYKNGKSKTAGSKIKSDDVRTHDPDNQPSAPSLPPPRLDPEHVADRRTIEMARSFYGHEEQEMPIPCMVFDSDQQEGLHDSPECAVGVSSAQNSLCNEDKEEVPCLQHAAISVDQLCDIIGHSTRGCPSRQGVFSSLDICLSHIIHDLSLASDDSSQGPSLNDCSVCLVLSQLLIHMADPGHAGCVKTCEQCSQIFHLIMLHCVGCIENVRPKLRLTQSDLCYKICKYSQWNVDKLHQNSHKLKGKVQKYCDKVLGNSLDMPEKSSKEGDPEGMGEIDGTVLFPDPPSSSTTLSFGGNIVTVETGDQDQGPLNIECAHSLFGNMSIFSLLGPSPVSIGAVASGGSTQADPEPHMKLHHKLSHPRKPPAIPQPIPEDSQQELSITDSPDDGKRDDTEKIIYQRMGYDPYETQKTYGDKHRYGSLQIGYVHDVEQFLSVSTQPLGAPGIGEVVFSHPPQLKLVAGFWDKKREECERTQTCPYQHREEGVILAEYKEYFSILRTRYQKHHQWERVSHLGNGMSGKCHLAIDLKTNFKFCCKKIHLLRYAEEELTLWSEMKNPYVVRLYGAIRHGVKIYIFSEFIDGGSLAACIEEQKCLGRRLSHWSAINYFQQLLKVLAFLQKKNVLHEDIKADNILLRRNSTYLAVTDFGTSRRLQDPKELKNKSPVGSPTHWSPEKASMEGHGFPSDVWAAVCVLVHMLSGEPPWVKRFMHKAAILNFIIFARSPPMEDVPGNVQIIVRDLIEKGFVKDPQARPSPGELLQHPAFKILDEGTPETYFSTLSSMAHSGVPPIQTAIGGGEHQSMRSEVPVFSTAGSAATKTTILYEGKVSIGPYQESDNRPDYKNKQASEMILPTSSEDYDTTLNQEQNEAGKDELAVAKEKRHVPSLEAPDEQLQGAPSIKGALAIENQLSVIDSSVDSKVRQLVIPLDIDSLLPQFNELFPSGDSLSTQSIKSFFADEYNTQEFNGVRTPALQMYKPEVKTDVLPNLSIFEWDVLPVARQSDIVSGSENAIYSSLPQAEALQGTVNPPIRDKLLHNQAHSQNAFMLSSESDDCTSADLFEPDPAAKNSDLTQHASDVQNAVSEADTHKPSSHPLEDASLTASSGSCTSTSALQMRKPTNLTLHCPTPPAELPHSHSDIQLLSAVSANEAELKQRSNTWSQLSSATHYSYYTGSTPSTSHSISTAKKTNGTSVPSTASSGHSQFSYYRGSVKEEQEKMIQELTTDMMNAYSPTSGDSTSSFFPDYQQPDTKTGDGDVKEYEDNTNFETLRRTMLESIGGTKFAGYDLKFYDDSSSKHLFTMHIGELPTSWKYVIISFRQKITQLGYIHFSLSNMNGTPVRYRAPLSAQEFRVIHRQDPGQHCWCQKCDFNYL